MLGWLILFALGAFITLAGGPSSSANILAGMVFALLFFVGLLTRVVRGPTC